MTRHRRSPLRPFRVRHGLWVLLVLGSSAGCAAEDSPQVGTNTSWLKACDNNAACGGVGSCECGICTASCAVEDECGGGICGSALATNAQCESAASRRLCLPAPEVDAAASCTVLPVTADNTLEQTNAACSKPNALLCEDFDAPLPAEYSTWYGTEQVASLQNCEVARGAGALKLQSNEFGYSQTRMRLASPVSEGALHVRFFGYFGHAFAIPEYVGLFELWTSENGPPKIGIDAVGDNQLEVNLSPFSSVLVSEPGVLRRDEWLCIELAVSLSEAKGAVTLSINGTPVINEQDVVTSPGEAFSVAVIEAAPAADSVGVDIVFDALVVATEPIGCE